MNINETFARYITIYGEDFFTDPKFKPIWSAIFDNVGDIDEILTIQDDSKEYNYTLMEAFFDSFMHNEAIAKTKDPLFYLYKSETNLNEPFNDSFIHIGISHDSSKGIPWFTLHSKSFNSNIKYHLVELNMIIEFPNLVQQFDGWINPGAADTYPRNLTEFKITDWDIDNRFEFENLYQLVLDQVLKHNIPYFGICAGAQHLILNTNGSLQPVTGFWDQTQMIIYQDFSLSSFLALNSQEKTEALLNCNMPPINVLSKTYNRYSAVSKDLGDLAVLDGWAEADSSAAMAYHINNGLQFATQYHIEETFDIVSRHANIMKSFLDIVASYHDHKFHHHINPQILYPFIEERLNTCRTQPNCELHQTKLASNELNYQDFIFSNQSSLMVEPFSSYTFALKLSN